jgi:hypothetical protein
MIIGFIYLIFYTALICLIPISLLYVLDEFLYRKGLIWTGTPMTFLILLVIIKALGISNLMDPGVMTDSGFDGTIYVILAVILICNTLTGLAILKFLAWIDIMIRRKNPGIYKYRVLLAILISIVITEITFFYSSSTATLEQLGGVIPSVYLSSRYPQETIGLGLLVASIIGFLLEIKNPINRRLSIHGSQPPTQHSPIHSGDSDDHT